MVIVEKRDTYYPVTSAQGIHIRFVEVCGGMHRCPRASHGVVSAPSLGWDKRTQSTVLFNHLLEDASNTTCNLSGLRDVLATLGAARWVYMLSLAL